MTTTNHTMKELAELKASEIMASPVSTVHAWDTLHDVAKLFVENNIGSAAVVDMDDQPLGIVTKSDITRYERERGNLIIAEQDKKTRHEKGLSEYDASRGFHLEPEEATLQSWMTPFVFDVHPNTILAAVIKKMVKNGLHHIFVTDVETKKIRGVITSFDVMLVLNRMLNPIVNEQK